MSEKKIYTKRLKSMLFTSIKKDGECWNCYDTRLYKQYSTPTSTSTLILTKNKGVGYFNIKNSNDEETILRYSWHYIPTNIKVYYYFLLLKRKIKMADKNRQDKYKIDKYKKCVETLSEQPDFKQYMRKEKLENLNK